jgi:hypothetical protein
MFFSCYLREDSIKSKCTISQKTKNAIQKILKFNTPYKEIVYRDSSHETRDKIQSFYSLSKFLNGINYWLNYIVIVPVYEYRNLTLEDFKKKYKIIIEKNQIKDEFRFDYIYMKSLFELNVLRKELDQLNEQFSKIENNFMSIFREVYLILIMKNDEIARQKYQQHIQNSKNIVPVFKRYFQLYLTIENNIDKEFNDLIHLNYEQMLFLCKLLKNKIENRIIQMISCLCFLYDSISEIYHYISLNKQINQTQVIDSLSNICMIYIDLQNQISFMDDMANTNVSHKSFANYLSHNLRSYTEHISNNSKIHQLRNILQQFKKYNLSYFDRIRYMFSFDEHNTIKSTILSFFIWLWNLVKLDSINIPNILEFLVYQLFCINNSDMNTQLGIALYELHKVMLLISKNKSML